MRPSSSLLLAYIAIGLFKHLVEGVLRDPSSLSKPSTFALPEGMRIGGILGSDVHWVLCWACWRVWALACGCECGWGIEASRYAWWVDPRTAQLVGLPASKLILLACALGGACAGLAGAIEVAAVHTSANASLIAAYGYAGGFRCRSSRGITRLPSSRRPFSLVASVAGSLLQRRLGWPM